MIFLSPIFYVRITDSKREGTRGEEKVTKKTISELEMGRGGGRESYCD